MESEILTYCSARIIEMIIDEYSKGKIDPELFISHTKVKAEFLRNHLDSIRTLNEQEHIKALIEEYDMLVAGISPVSGSQDKITIESI